MVFFGFFHSGSASFLTKLSSMSIRNKVFFYDELARMAWHDMKLFKDEHLASICNYMFYGQQKTLSYANLQDCQRRIVLPYEQENWIFRVAARMGLNDVQIMRDNNDSNSVMSVVKVGSQTILSLSKDMENAFFHPSKKVERAKGFTLSQARASVIHELTHASENHSTHLVILKIFQVCPDFFCEFSKHAFTEKNGMFPHRNYLVSPFFYAAYSRFLESRADQGVFDTKDKELIDAYKKLLEKVASKEAIIHRKLKDYDKNYGTSEYDLHMLRKTHPLVKNRVQACAFALAALKDQKNS